MQSVKINDQVSVGGQPAEADIRQLRQLGFRSIVNVRTDGEKNQPLSPQAEGEIVSAAGMQYAHIPVSMKTIRPEVVDQFRATLSALPKPAFVHCMGGKRAAAVVLMDVAREQRLTSEELFSKAEELGFRYDEPEMERFVRQYVESPRSPAD